ncbi:MAG: phenylacetate--CoA ligase family protein [Bacteroidales bacterium]|nr:phenylacetate--CoA ligase family protein [Bacteroidales bacterium]
MTKLLRTILVDRLSGKTSAKYYRLYSETQWYDRSKLNEFQLYKLKLLLFHCFNSVPFYKKVIEDLKIDLNRIDSLDVLKRFPVITKQTILENYNDFIPQNLSQLSLVKTSPTGGTTGRILLKRTDVNLRSSVWGSYRRFIDWMGIRESDAKLKLLGGHIKKPGLIEKLKYPIINSLNNDYAFDPYDTSDKNVNRIREVLSTKNIRLIRSYSQYLYNLAQQFDRNNETFHIKAIMTTAEPLMPEHRQLFKKVFNAESYDQYGSGEIGAIAFECDKHMGLHITEERVIVEQDENNNMIFTDLDNFAMPYIRYKNEDQAVIIDKPCLCGRQHRLIERVLGRSCDYILGSNGKNLHWAFFWHLMFDTEIAHNRNIIKFQVKQTDKTKILFRYVGDSLTTEDEEILKLLMFDKLGKMNISFTREKDIENAASGKYRPVVNDLLLKH